jgi:anti-sigma factor RsiW
MNVHEQFAEDLSLYALGVLQGDERVAPEKHLEECTACRRELEQLRGEIGINGFVDGWAGAAATGTSASVGSGGPRTESSGGSRPAGLADACALGRRSGIGGGTSSRVAAELGSAAKSWWLAESVGPATGRTAAGP